MAQGITEWLDDSQVVVEATLSPELEPGDGHEAVQRSFERDIHTMSRRLEDRVQAIAEANPNQPRLITEMHNGQSADTYVKVYGGMILFLSNRGLLERYFDADTQPLTPLSCVASDLTETSAQDWQFWIPDEHYPGRRLDYLFRCLGPRMHRSWQYQMFVITGGRRK